MLNDPVYTKFLELSWRRNLTASEAAELRAWLAAQPEAQADWETERGLAEALGRLPDAAVPSNFTASILQEVEREQAAQARERRAKQSWWRRLSWLPRPAVAAAILGTAFLARQHFQTVRRQEMLQSMVAVSNVPSLPGPDVLQDFDAIAALNQSPPADRDLLTLLQ